MGELRRDLWRPDWDCETVEMMGEDWPIIMVSKFERNEIGERRYIETREYRPIPPTEGLGEPRSR